MKFNELQVQPRQTRKRVGRGIAAGQGKTAGRGTKGQLARTGKKLSPTFSGGQGPLAQRVPKLPGFKSLRVPAQVVYTMQLDDFAGDVADNHTLAAAGLIATPHHTVKIIVKGELTRAVKVQVQAASKAAIETIAKAGGSFDKTAVPLKVSSKTSDKS